MEKEKYLSEITVKELIDYLLWQQEKAGQICQESEGTQGCDEANLLTDIITRIKVDSGFLYGHKQEDFT